ncbi:hypothetical protein EDB81DRAFT_842476 [Dactylonectria macrodidyma]|uniref:Uncharacterized protein n=1 Tax=Dactylonectria macrodidyma TaxID=307937 RepID=A0A9P9ESN0_9HYPO|nr:hypothetical protein EDB81DRAFT_842476 [Dactylonectria macrodidyma]
MESLVSFDSKPRFRTEGVVAVTSVWLKDRTAPESLHQIVDGYEQVVDNLNAHTHPGSPFPTPEGIRKLIKSGPPVYGMAAVGDDIPLSDGAELLLDRLTSLHKDPLWVIVWGGVNVLAQVLHRIRLRPDATELRSKLRVYTISDQDDCGSWIRQQWPDIFYICSVHGWNQYNNATWIGMSGDIIDGLCDNGGLDGTKNTGKWVKENIQVGPLGAQYPDPEFIFEGDTPSFLYLMQNGLGASEEPSYGSWGGRYIPINVSAKGIPARGHFADASDTVMGADGHTHCSNKATIWRWRNAFQNDFAARMQWTMIKYWCKTNHHPVVIVNGHGGLSPIFVEADAGSTITFDTSGTYDPDGDGLSINWFQYKEPSATLTYHSLLRTEDYKPTKIVILRAPRESPFLFFSFF